MEPVPPLISETTITCISCGYNLTGVSIGSNCPECGERVDQSILIRRMGNQSCGYATAALVLGIISLVACFLLGPVAIYYGKKARTLIDAGGYNPSSRGLATAGYVLGIIGTCILCIYVLIFVMMIATNI